MSDTSSNGVHKNSIFANGVFATASRPEERVAAAERRQTYPYRFPRDMRKMGGKFDVTENQRRLLRYFYFERRLMQGLGSWTLSIPDFETKIETGRHIFWHADAARRFRERLSEQEAKKAQIDGYRDAEIDMLIDEVLSATDTPELLVGIHQMLGRAIEITYRHHIDDTCPVTDAPTIRILKQILVDFEPMLEWADAAINAYIDGGVDESRLAQWHWHLSRVLASIGGVTGSDARTERPHLRIDNKPYVRGDVPMRDARFITFHLTGDYDIADGTPRFPRESYDNTRLRFARAQRDEVDAIEAFGTFIWDIRFKDWQSEYDLARITWDEARHTEIGYRTMQVMGYDPYELPNRLTSSTCRGPMEPEYAMAEINLFGEVGVIKTINDFIDQTRSREDAVLAHIGDFIRADERTHVRKGQGIIKNMTDKSMQELELRTRELFTECLVSLGAVKPDGDLFVITREDLEHYIGE